MSRSRGMVPSSCPKLPGPLSTAQRLVLTSQSRHRHVEAWILYPRTTDPIENDRRKECIIVPIYSFVPHYTIYPVERLSSTRFIHRKETQVGMKSFLRLGGGIGDLDIGEVFLADGAEGVSVCRRDTISFFPVYFQFSFDTK